MRIIKHTIAFNEYRSPESIDPEKDRKQARNAAKARRRKLRGK